MNRIGAKTQQKSNSHVRTHAHVSQINPGSVRFDDLPEVLGVPSLYPHQVAGINALVNGGDLLLTAATGSGKTEVFIGAGLIRGGVTLIVSPLLSLIADQYRRFTELGIPVRIWNSDVKDSYKDETTALLRSGWQGFVITTPESLKTDRLFSALAGRVDLAAVDEAHCVLKDCGFRINYGFLGQTLERLKPSVRMACTATLSIPDQDSLCRTLRLQHPMRIILPLSRSNLTIKIAERYPGSLTAILNNHLGECGIVFCATVRVAKSLYATLESQGRSVVLYHGQLGAKAKKEAQAGFMSGERKIGIVTDAFLLGIDKPDLRFTVHWDYPESIENWVQGFGRAGRDGLPATVYGAFLGSMQGKQSRQFLVSATYPDVNYIRDVWHDLITVPFCDDSASAIAERVLGREGRYSGGAIMTALKRHGLVKADPHPEDGRRRRYSARGNFDHVDWEPYLRERRGSQQRFDCMCALVRLPEELIPDAIDRYFGTTDPVAECVGVV